MEFYSKLLQLLNMSFGDWEMFKVTLIQLREYEITSILRQDEAPQPTVRKSERKGKKVSYQKI